MMMRDRQIFGSSRLPGPLGLAPGASILATTKAGVHAQNILKQPMGVSPAKKADPKPVIAYGKIPVHNGEVNTYNVSEFAIFWVPETFKSTPGLVAPPTRQKLKRSARKGKYKVVFVNGQLGNDQKHKMQACALAAVSGGPVCGIYNTSRGLLLDSLKSGWLKITTSGLMKLESKVYEVLEGQKASETAIHDHLHRWDCPASAALFNLLLKEEYHDARIVGHSQGNIIICNAINGIIACRGKEAVKDMQVIAVASPTFFWNKAVNHTIYNMKNDFVGWLSGDLPTLPSGVMGWSALGSADKSDTSEIVTHYEPAKRSSGDYWLTHSFYLYLSELWISLQPAFP
jgi:hypothetical protein